MRKKVSISTMIAIKDRAGSFYSIFRKTVISLELNVCLFKVIHHVKGNIFFYLMMWKTLCSCLDLIKYNLSTDFSTFIFLTPFSLLSMYTHD